MLVQGGGEARTNTHSCMSHVTRMNGSCHTNFCSGAHVNTSVEKQKYALAIPMNESFHIYRWVMSHIWMSHVTHIDESYHT